MMAGMITLILTGLLRGVRTQRSLVFENLVLRHQLAVLRRTASRPRLRTSDRLFWVLLSRLWIGWTDAVSVVQPATAQWTAQQIVEAFPWETAPRYLLRDRDAVYGVVFSSRVQALGILEVKAAPRSPWQNPYVERLIGTLRRECLDHVVVLNETHLRRLLRDYLVYYHRVRTHLSLEKDSPEPRPVEHPDQGGIVEMPMVGGLHHQYTRLAA